MQRDFAQLRNDLKKVIDVLDYKAVIDLSYHLSDKIELSLDRCLDILKEIATKHYHGTLLDQHLPYLDKRDRYELRLYASLYHQKVESMLQEVGYQTNNGLKEILSIVDRFPYSEYDAENQTIKICYYQSHIGYSSGFDIYISDDKHFVFCPEKQELHPLLRQNQTVWK